MNTQKLQSTRSRTSACASLLAFACVSALAATPPATVSPPVATTKPAVATAMAPPAAAASVSTPATTSVPAVPAVPALPAPAPGPSVLGNDRLKPGEFAWQPQFSTGGPLLVVVNIKEQMAYVYRNGLRIGRTSVSTGKRGHETPTGVFTILEKHEEHYSNKYNNAPMPFMQRLTWDGVALHAGKIPGYPASHGCVRLPLKFAEQLFRITERGGTVVVSEDGSMDALARAGVDLQLALLIGGTDDLHELGGSVLADQGDVGSREYAPAQAEGSALSP